jgi:D-alanyl-lipoteichoic acid acyltransferase DltB (MBOAT superfamily)
MPRPAMLFSSYVFVFAFLPLTLLGYYALVGRAQRSYQYGFLLLASLFFYGYWKLSYLPLLLISIAFNFAVGARLAAQPASRRLLLPLGVAANVLALAYYKYAGPSALALNALYDLALPVPSSELPLAISFCTFLQVAYLVDCARGEARPPRFLDYSLFVVYFPHLIAGPIVHHSELLPQFERDEGKPPIASRLASGSALFAAGLFKKAVLADGVAPFANSVFASADAGGTVTFVDGWVGALAYTLQLYFDFSGYSDMALGISLMFGVQLPLNFDSPYQARNIIDFWRRWHITLSRFLRDYVYVSLGGNRKGHARRYANLMITMVLGGLWHGAGINFVLWGALHGAFLLVNHAYRHACEHWSLRAGPRLSRVTSYGYWALTFVAVVAAWVLFRAQTFGGAFSVLGAMARFDAIAVPPQLASVLPASLPLIPDARWVVSLREPVDGIARVTGLLVVALALPNTHTLLSHHLPALGVAPSPLAIARWFAGFRLRTALLAGLALGAALVLMTEDEFLYFNF